MGQIQDLQQRAWRNKQAKGFNTTNVEHEFNCTYGELAEAYDAYRHGRTDEIGAELADVAIFLLGLSEMLGIDLETAMLTKMTINEKRIYHRVNGRLVKKENQ